MHVKRSHKLSVCLVNLASLLTEFGPIKPIKSMKEIESRNVLSAEELKEKIFRKRNAIEENDDMSRLMLKEMEDRDNEDDILEEDDEESD